MSKFKVGDAVTVTDGSMKGLYGTVIGFYAKQDAYLVRFTGSQQMFYNEERIVHWTRRQT